MTNSSITLFDRTLLRSLVVLAVALVLSLGFVQNAQAQEYGGSTYDSAPVYGGSSYDSVPVYGGSMYETATSYTYGGSTYDTNTPVYGGSTYDSLVSTAPTYGGSTYDSASVVYGGSTYESSPIYGGSTYDTTGPVYGGSTYDSPVYGGSTYDSYYSGSYGGYYYPYSYGYGGYWYGGSYYTGSYYPTSYYPTTSGGSNNNYSYNYCNGTNNCNYSYINNSAGASVVTSPVSYTTPYPTITGVYPVAVSGNPWVSLSALPYTGLDLGLGGTILYWAFLILWCLFAAYLIVVKRAHTKIRTALFGDAGTDTHGAVVEATHVHVSHTTVVTPVTDAIDPFIMDQIKGRTE